MKQSDFEKWLNSVGTYDGNDFVLNGETYKVVKDGKGYFIDKEFVDGKKRVFKFLQKKYNKSAYRKHIGTSYRIEIRIINGKSRFIKCFNYFINRVDSEVRIWSRDAKLQNLAEQVTNKSMPIDVFIDYMKDYLL